MKSKKRTPVILPALSFLFALAALAIALYGLWRPTTQEPVAQVIQTETPEPTAKPANISRKPEDLPEGIYYEGAYEEWGRATDVTSRFATMEELGFTFTAPASWGEAVFTFQPGRIFAGGGTYSGNFLSTSVQFSALVPRYVEGREGYIGDALGYEKREDGYVLKWIPSADKLFPVIPVPADQVVDEIKTKNGSALVIRGKATEDMSFFPTDPRERVAIFNISNGATPAGVFFAAPDVPAIEFRTFLESLETK